VSGRLTQLLLPRARGIAAGLLSARRRACPPGRYRFAWKAAVVTLNLASALSRFSRFEEDERLAEG
jgi:hypothetical protein